MENKNTNKKRYLTKSRRKAQLKIKILVSLFAIIALSGVFSYEFYMLDKEIDGIINRQNLTVARVIPKKQPEQPKPVLPATLTNLGAMGQEIWEASQEFGTPWELIVGIANAESSLGTNFYKEFDRNCFNLWGLKGGNLKYRKDGSSLRCFINEKAGARTVAKTLRLYYLDEGRETAKEICQKWVGGKFSKTHCDSWVKNVQKFYNK